MPAAIIFPGQGAASSGMGRPWVDHPAWHVVRAAEEATERPLAHLLLEASDDELAHTDAGQLSVLVLSLMAFEAIREAVPGDEPVAFAGHSLGQITALIASGAIAWDAGLRLAAARADACETSARRSPGRMAALIGANLDQAHTAVQEVDAAWVANDNAPGQIVLAGRPDSLARALEPRANSGCAVRGRSRSVTRSTRRCSPMRQPHGRRRCSPRRS